MPKSVTVERMTFKIGERAKQDNSPKEWGTADAPSQLWLEHGEPRQVRARGCPSQKQAYPESRERAFVKRYGVETRKDLLVGELRPLPGSVPFARTAEVGILL